MEVWNLLLWCHQRGITLKVRHIPGRFNILADYLSRMLKPVLTEWWLSQTIANLVFSMTGYPSIDLFATRLNNRLPMYVSPIPDSKALAIDTLSISWDHIHGYAFPLFHVIPAILNKICLFQCRIVLEAPVWPQRSWFPDLLQLLAPPLRLPNIPVLLGQLEGRHASKPTNACPSRLGIIKQSITDKKFSREVADLHLSAAKRLSTRKVYDAKWTVFTNWCRQRKINPVLASPRIIADFLLQMSEEKKCQVSTIKGYRSIISNTLKFKSGTNIGLDPIISWLIKAFEIQRPIQRFLAPKWDLAGVLSSLYKDPYEPLHKASLLRLTVKTVFLLTMATAKWVSEIHALAIDTDHLRFDKTDGSVSLRT